MIRAVLKRVAVDLWDNAVAVFALNLALLGLGATLLYGLSLAWRLAPAGFVAALVLTLWLGSMLLAAVAALVGEIAQRADLDPRAMRPDPLFCAGLAFTVAGLAGAGILLLTAEGGGGGPALARGIGGLWLCALAAQIFAFSPVFALDRGTPVVRRLMALMALAFAFPLRGLCLGLLSLALLAVTVGLLPGPAGIGYLFLRAGRVLSRSAGADGKVARAAAVAEELRPLQNRNGRNLIQPWRGP